MTKKLTPIEQGELNRANIRFALAHYPGITQREIAKLLDLSFMAVSRHIRAIRKEWRK